MSIIANKDILDEDYIPPRLPGREPQIKELEINLRPCVNKEKPANTLLFGKPGTGKTATARYVLSQLEEHTPAQGLYINCWQAPSLHSILEKMLTQLRILDTFQQNTAIRLENLEKEFKSLRRRIPKFRIRPEDLNEIRETLDLLSKRLESQLRKVNERISSISRLRI